MYRRQFAILLSLIATVSTGAAAEEPYALLIVDRVPEALPVVSVPVDLEALAQAIGLTEAVQPGRIECVLEVDGALHGLHSQFDPEPGSAAKGTLSVYLPRMGQERAGGRIYLKAPPKPLPPQLEPAPDLTVQQADGRTVIANGHYRVTHDPQRMAGLPWRFEFLGTGKVFDTFSFNDRVHNPDAGSFLLRGDPQARPELAASGPLRAVVRVRARYTQGGKQPKSAPEATYTFTYYADSPLIRVEADVSQKQAQHWNELHFIELNYPDESFTHWAADDPAKTTALAADAQSHTGNRWAAFVQGNSVLGLVAPSPIRIYDGRGGYGTYLHGPWATWDDTEQHFRARLFVSAEKDALAELDAASRMPPGGTVGRITTPRFLAELQRLRGEVQRLPAGRRGAFGWTLSLIDRLGQQPDQLLAAQEALAGVAEDLEAGRDRPYERLRWWPMGEQTAAATWIENGHLGLGFATPPIGGAHLLSLFDFAKERELLAATGVPLFDIELSHPDGRTARVTAETDWASHEVTGRGGGATRRGGLVCSRPTADGLPGLRVECDFELAGRRLAWRLRVDNPDEQWAIHQVHFPQVALGQIGGSAEDDFVATPRASGELRKAPLLNPYSFGGLYPSGWATMQFLCHYDQDVGVYFAAEDPLASTKDLNVKTSDAGEALIARVTWPNADMDVPGSGFTHPGWTVLETFEGDWFDAARIYARWAAKEAQWWPKTGAKGRADTPEWMQEVAIWALTGGDSQSVVGPVTEFAQYMGVPTAIHWYNWHVIPFDNDYPHYFPAKEGFADGVAALQDAGVRVMPYINGRLWDSDLDDFKTTAIKAATKDAKGDYYVEVYGSGEKLVPMCPTTELWQTTVQDTVLRLVSPEFNVDGVYIDQIAAASPRICMDDSHGHPLGGGHWWTTDGYWPMLTSLQGRLPAGKMITSECNAESYTTHLDGLLTWHFQYQDMIPLFAAVYGGQVQLFSRAYNGTDGLSYRMKAAQSLVFGEQIGWIRPDIIKDEVNGPFLRRMARLRHALLPYLSWGEMARPPTLTGDIPQVTADWAWSGEWPITDTALQRGAWKSRDGRLALIFVNVTDQTLSATLEFDAEAYGFALRQRIVCARRTEDALEEPVPLATQANVPIELPPYGAVALEIRATR